MSQDREVDKSITAEVAIGGSNQGNVVIGSGNRVAAGTGNFENVRVTAAELAGLNDLFAEVRSRIEREAPADRREAALERIDELKEAVVKEKPDLTTMAYVRQWFLKSAPGLAGHVVSVFINPIVGKLVEAAGEMTAEAFLKRFGRPE